MSTESNKVIVRRYFDEAWNGRNLGTLDEISEPAYAAEDRAWIPVWLAAFPDIHVTIDELVAEGNTVVAAITVRGTHQGELGGEPVRWLTAPLSPTGKQVEARGVFAWRIGDGRMQYEGRWGVADWLDLLRQLGAVPRPGEVTAGGGR
jgi:predicted ester cyclase